MNYDLIRPFGPLILKSKIPDYMVQKINEYVEHEENRQKKFPNLLSRDVINTYLENEFSKEIGFTDFVEDLGNEYLNKSTNIGQCKKVIMEPIIPEKEDYFENIGEIYADAWVNRYFDGDYTPVHKHTSVISGVGLLKISVDLIKEQIYNSDGTIRESEASNGKLEFIMNSSDFLCNNIWVSPQEIGTILIFPGWLMHHTYPFRNKKERRTISFNLNYERN